MTGGFLDDALEWLEGGLDTFTLLEVYIASAVAGGTVLLGQAGLNLFGLGGDTDIDADVDADELDVGDDSVSFVSIRTLASFMTIFGLVGWLGTSAGWGAGWTALAAFGAGSSILLVVANLMFMFKKLASSGNLRPIDAIGTNAKVYLKVPGGNAGKGKITVSLQSRSVEFDAVTWGDELPTRSGCKLVAMTTEDTFPVEPLNQKG